MTCVEDQLYKPMEHRGDLDERMVQSLALIHVWECVFHELQQQSPHQSALTISVLQDTILPYQ